MNRLLENFENGQKIIRYVYDGFNRVIKTIQLGQNENRIERCTFDGLNRLIAKTLLDDKEVIYAHESYEYDVFGNRIQKTIKQSEDKTAIYRSSYNSDGTQNIKKTRSEIKQGGSIITIMEIIWVRLSYVKHALMP